MNIPKQFEERMRAMLGSEYDDFLRAFNEETVYSGIRVNTLRTGAADTVRRVFGELEPVPWCRGGFYADKSMISGKHPLHIAGVFYFQEPSAMCAVSGLPVEKGDFVLDLCAAPGGKSTQAAAKLGGTGLLVANEIVRSRAEILSENIERMGVINAVVTNEAPDRLAEKFPQFFDKIIVDAPCSGEGMFRKEAAAVTEWSIEHTVSCGIRQKNILASAIEMLKPNGLLMYSTCTFAPEENETVAAWLIDHGMTLIPAPELSMLSSGKTEWSGSDYDMSAARRIFPHLHRGEGHFAALFKKNGSDAVHEKPSGKKKKKRCDAKDAALEEAVGLYREFEKKTLNVSLKGHPVLFGDRLYLMPEGINIEKLRVLRCGLWVGTVKKKRFEPSHSLALALGAEDFKAPLMLGIEDKMVTDYLSGSVIPCDGSGWRAVCAGGYALGWGKCSGGMMKNHFPKGLRLRG